VKYLLQMIVSILTYVTTVVMEVDNYSAEEITCFFEIHGSTHLRISLFPANWSHFTPVVSSA